MGTQAQLLSLIKRWTRHLRAVIRFSFASIACATRHDPSSLVLAYEVGDGIATEPQTILQFLFPQKRHCPTRYLNQVTKSERLFCIVGSRSIYAPLFSKIWALAQRERDFGLDFAVTSRVLSVAPREACRGMSLSADHAIP